MKKNLDKEKFSAIIKSPIFIFMLSKKKAYVKIMNTYNKIYIVL